MSEGVASTDLSRQRARRYARWYPREWRDRYEDEFVAHLEVEIAERPHDLRRGVDIALHGVLAHTTFRHSRRRAILTVTVVVMVTLVASVALIAGRYFAPLKITPGSELTTESIGIATTRVQVNDLAYFFNAPNHVRVIITSGRRSFRAWLRRSDDRGNCIG